MKEVNASSPKVSQSGVQVQQPDPAKFSTMIPTSPGTLSITLTAPPAPSVPLQQNVSLWVAVITLVGVVLSLIAAERRTKKELLASEARMRTELAAAARNATIEREQTREQAALDRQHSSERAHQDRITVARRAVYLELIDELTKAHKFMALLAAPNPEEIDPGALLGGFAAAITKMSLLGEMDTVITSREFQIAMHRTLAKAMPMSFQLMMMRNMAEQYREQHEAAQAEVARLSAEIANHIETHKDDTPGLEKMEAAIQESQAKAERHRTDEAAAQMAVFSGQQAYMAMLLEDESEINRKLDDLIYAIRTELGLETSIERLRQSTAEIKSILEATTDDVVSARMAATEAV